MRSILPHTCFVTAFPSAVSPSLFPPRCSLSPPSSARGITASNVSHWWPSGRQVLDDISLHVKPGELTMIVGENGCGKSTLLSLFIGLLEPIQGNLSIEEPCAFVHQRPDYQILFPTVGMEISTSIQRTPDMTDDDVRERTIAAMEAVGLVPWEEFVDTSSFRLSGGQKQRVVVASALAMEPKSFLFDEVTASMDPVTKAELLARIHKIVKEKNIAALW